MNPTIHVSATTTKKPYFSIKKRTKQCDYNTVQSPLREGAFFLLDIQLAGCAHVLCENATSLFTSITGLICDVSATSRGRQKLTEVKSYATLVFSVCYCSANKIKRPDYLPATVSLYFKPLEMCGPLYK